MLVTISGTPYFSAHLWNEIYYSGGPGDDTWGDVNLATWMSWLSPYGNLVMANGPSVKDIVEDRSTADFTILDTAHAYSFQKGQYVTVRDFNYDIIFTGFIETAVQQRISPSGVIAHQISCTDNHYLADKRVIAKAFVVATTPTIGDCVQWIVDNILDNEGVTVGAITATTAIESISFDYTTCSEALDNLAQYGDCTWFIDFEKKLYFVPRSTYNAAWNISEVAGIMTDVLLDSFQVTSSNPEYRNQQYIRGGYAKTALQTEISKGDGDTSSFPVGYKIAEQPVIHIDIGAGYIDQTIGIKGVDTGKNWYWSANDQIITQDAGGTRLTSTGKIKIEYYGLYQIVTSSANYAEIIARQAAEGGGTGIVDSIRDDSLVTTEDAGLEEANALLAHYADIGTKIDYVTLRSGLEVGTLQHIESTIHGVDDDFLITQVEKISEFHDPALVLDDIVRYRITGISGPVEDFWTKFFLKLKLGAGSTGSIANSTSVVLILRSFSNTWAEEDDPNIWLYAVPDPDLAIPATPSTEVVPSFEAGQKIMYIALCYGGTEYFRKYYTAQTETSTAIVSTFIVSSGEGNYHWDNIKVYGGDTATSTAYSGVLLYTISDDYTKNNLEALQIVLTDLKWA